MNNKIVYLLGAGAMLDFGAPTTKNLTDDYKLIVQNGDYKEIIDILNQTYRADYNFETIIASVEYLMDWAIARQTIGATAQYTNVIRAIFETQIKNIKTETIASLYKELINHLINIIMRYDCFIDENQNQLLLKRYFSNVKKEHKVKIYSLNYDRLIPQMFSNINDGIINAVNRRSQTFSYDINSFAKDKFTYFNLHGSIYLRQDPYKYNEVVQSFMPEHIEYCIPQDGGSPNDTKIFCPIIAGYSKSQRVLSEPFHFGFSSFCTDCSDCEKLIIVGYSFADPHINSILKNYVYYKRKQMDIVDYNENGDYRKITEQLTYSLNCIEGFTPQPYGAKSQNVTIYMKGFISYMNEICQL